MSARNQIAICIVLVVALAAGWYALGRPGMPGVGATETAAGGQGGDGGRGGSRGGSGGSGVPGVLGPGGALNVITATVATGQGGDTVTALGTAKAVRSVTLFPQVTGIVTEVAFTPGEQVKAGTVLLRLDSDEQSVAVDKAKVTLDQQRATFTRQQALAQSKTIAAVALSDAETAVRLAEIEVRNAEIALGRRTIAAPFDGIVGLTDLSIGDLVTTTTPISTLDDLATIRVAFEVPERWAPLIRIGQPIQGTAQGLPASSFDGKVSAIDSRIDAATRTLRLEADLANPNGVLKTGMAITVAMAFQSDDQLSVPTLSVLWDRKGSYLWKVVDGVAHRAEVTILSRESGTVLVSGDVASGDTVVVEGIQRLREGGKVKPIEAYATVAADGTEGGGTAGGAAAPASSSAPDGSAAAPLRPTADRPAARPQPAPAAGPG